MTNQNDRNLDQQQPKTNDTADQSRTNQTQQSGHPTQQDSSRKDSSRADDSRSHGNEGSDQGEKRRAS
jgi:hypothetical protein